MKVYHHIKECLTLQGAHSKDGRCLDPSDLGNIKDASIAFDDNEIKWVGPSRELPEEYKGYSLIDASDFVITPELIDCHTHLVFGGNRSKEYVDRLNGKDYQEIAKSGGGILFTMEQTNKSTDEQLLQIARERIQKIANYGVGTIEIKSGYSLTYDGEKRLTLLINQLKEEFSPSIQIKNTFMAAHAIPKGFKNSAEFLNKVVFPLLKEMAPLNIIDAVDIFHETGYFNYQDTEELFMLAQQLGLPVKSHADEFVDNKGALLAAQNNALSTDHLLCTQKDGILALSQSKTVATLLPGTGFFLGKAQANARAFLDAGVKVAIGSDYNPGSCHFDNVLFIASLAAPNYHMNITELWSAITLNSAHALGLYDQGAIQSGLRPRFSLFKADCHEDITYHWGKNFFYSSSL